MDLVCITVDSADPASIAAFWSDALSWNAAAVEPEGAVAICRPPWGGAFLEFARVPQEKTVKNRVHLGCSAGSLDDLDAELTRLQSLGASIAWEEQFTTAVAASYRNVILRDVEGNEFCLSGSAPKAPPMLDELAVHVRPFEPQDRSRVLDLAKRLSSTTPAWRDRAAVDDAVRASISDILDTSAPEQAVLVAEVNGEAIGVLTVSERMHYTGALDASIDDLVVAEEWEGRGVGRALLQSAENWALARGCERITVETGAGNERALRLYRTARFNDEDVRLTKALQI